MLVQDIFNASISFETKAMQIFYFQAEENDVYAQYLKYLKINPFDIETIDDIPFLPISFFKTHKVVCRNMPIETVFKSSGTGNKRSTHYLVNTALYKQSFLQHFEEEFGSLEEISVFALLPNYQDNPNSSLLFMVNELIAQTSNNGSKYLNWNDSNLIKQLEKLQYNPFKTILIGVSFALLDIAEKHSIDLSNVILMETGGMKGRRKELTRDELHHSLKKAFNLKTIYSEYGMCELLSQAYSKEKGIFVPPSWMKVLSRPIQEPYSKMEFSKTGQLKIIDLANIFSCSFIETEDIGKVYANATFEVLGRLDAAELRGCNLMYV